MAARSSTAFSSSFLVGESELESSAFSRQLGCLSSDIVTGCGGNRMRSSRHTAFVSDECHFARAKEKMAEKIWPQTLNPF